MRSAEEILQFQHKFVEALEQYQIALGIFRSLSPGHPWTIKAKNELKMIQLLLQGDASRGTLSIGAQLFEFTTVVEKSNNKVSFAAPSGDRFVLNFADVDTKAEENNTSIFKLVRLQHLRHTLSWFNKGAKL